MIGNTQDSRGSCTRRRNRISRWRSIFITLLLIFAIGSTSQTALAQDETCDEGGCVQYSLKPNKDGVLMCSRTSVNIRVAVLETFLGPGRVLRPGWIPNKVTGVTVFGYVDDENIGTLSPPSQVIGTPPKPDFAVFKFTAKGRPGRTVIIFTVPRGSIIGGLGGYRLIRDLLWPVSVKVDPCKFRTETLGDFNLPGEAQGHVSAISDEAEVKAPDAESPFTGSTSVDWFASVGRVRDCGGAATIGSSKLDWNGTMDESGQLNLNGNFQTAAGSFDIECARGEESFSESMPLEMTLDPVSVSVASSGGVISQSQTLEWEGANPGRITIIIVPVEDTGVAVIPGIHDVSWDDFSSLFAALIPLP